MREAWRLLREHHAELVEDVADGKRFVWLGSGISRDQVPDLVELLARVLRFLRDRALSNEGDAEAHREALLEIIDEHMPGELQRFLNDGLDWVPDDLEPLRDRYSRVLSVGVTGKPSDYLLIDGAGLPSLYGDSDLEPGPAHILIAMLISEGVVKYLASGNWDALIEKALVSISATDSLLDVYVDVDDPRSAHGHAEIAKFHGCAVLAREDPERYRDKVIATTAQISKLHGDVAYAHMTDRLRDLTTRMRSLVLGLSVQDSDLLAIFRAAANRSPWAWEPAHPAYLFAEHAVSASQRDVLEVAYGAEFALERQLILQRSALGAFAGPVTAAILVEVLALKFTSALHRHQDLPLAFMPMLEEGIRRLILRAVAAFGPDETSLTIFLLGGYPDILRTYLGPAATGAARYLPFSRGTRSHLQTDITVVAMGLDRLAVAVGLIGWGEKSGRWRASLTDQQVGSRIFVSRRRAQTGVTVIVVRGSKEAIAVMASDDWISGHGEMVLVQMEMSRLTPVRSPGGRIGRGRVMKTRRGLAWGEMSDSVEDVPELLDRFETGVGL